MEGRGHPVKRETISRRRALQQAALLLGGAISAPTVAAVFSTATRRAWAASPAWAPRTLSAAQLELAATLAEHIIPQTETPGARAAGVHRFVDSLLTDHYAAAERDRFLAGLAAVDSQAQSRHGKTFVESTTGQQLALLRELDAAAYAATRGEDTWFFRRMKELTLVGYYTSEIGAMQELHVSPFGTYHGDIPYTSVGRAWA
jgi:gluconate 2-dehydrogenase gamma chain